jgi:hypothetical protein
MSPTRDPPAQVHQTAARVPPPPLEKDLPARVVPGKSRIDFLSRLWYHGGRSEGEFTKYYSLLMNEEFKALFKKTVSTE